MATSTPATIARPRPRVQANRIAIVRLGVSRWNSGDVITCSPNGRMQIDLSRFNDIETAPVTA